MYFIMPMPGSQTIDSIDLAYFLHAYRWMFRIALSGAIVWGSVSAFSIKHKWIPVLVMLLVAGVTYVFNFRMSADHMFLQAEDISFASITENSLLGSRLVIGVDINGEAKAYPIEYLAYHHQVQDSIGGKAAIITYCSVCRTGRVYAPYVNGKYEKFRLVGMDHYNAMFEDATTGSWWRQATGEAVTGILKGASLPDIESTQMTVDKFFELHPNGKVMLPDPSFTNTYDSSARFERGKSLDRLTRTDTASWQDKSWVVGIRIGDVYKAYDWNELKTQRVINDNVNGISIVLALSADGQSFVAFEKPPSQIFSLQRDTLFADGVPYNFSGASVSGPSVSLRKIKAYQEFWHSWKTFHPATLRHGS